MLRRYGVSIEELEQLLIKQQDRCAICKRRWQECVPAKRVRYEKTFLQHLCIDHDHVGGNVRGLLCNACNTAIGLFGEDAQRLESAIDYLRQGRTSADRAAEVHRLARDSFPGSESACP